MSTNLEFPYFPGDQFKRADMHELVGGSFRHGMTKCNNGQDYLLFHDAKNSKKFGYDKWEGLQADGSFHYSGQGTVGNQSMTRANLGLVRANDEGIPIHLIESTGGICTYLGQYILGEPAFRIEKAPDVRGEQERDVYVFNLIPISNCEDLDLSSLKSLQIEGFSRPWVRSDFETIDLIGQVKSKTQIERTEIKLQAEFGEFLLANGHEVFSHIFYLNGRKGGLKPDFWIPCLGLVVEAKPSNSREFVRMAIGQVLDYANLSSLEGHPMKPAILLPNRPIPDLSGLIGNLGITLIFKNQSNHFEFQFS